MLESTGGGGLLDVDASKKASIWWRDLYIVCGGQEDQGGSTLW